MAAVFKKKDEKLNPCIVSRHLKLLLLHESRGVNVQNIFGIAGLLKYKTVTHSAYFFWRIYKAQKNKTSGFTNT